MAVLGAGGQGFIRQIVFADDASWTPPFGCKAIVTVIGGGGSGGAAKGNGTSRVAATGGGAGGTVTSLLTLSDSVT